jgi:hypothetical protein
MMSGLYGRWRLFLYDGLHRAILSVWVTSIEWQDLDLGYFGVFTKD